MGVFALRVANHCLKHKNACKPLLEKCMHLGFFGANCTLGLQMHERLGWNSRGKTFKCISTLSFGVQ